MSAAMVMRVRGEADHDAAAGAVDHLEPDEGEQADCCGPATKSLGIGKVSRGAGPRLCETPAHPRPTARHGLNGSKTSPKSDAEQRACRASR